MSCIRSPKKSCWCGTTSTPAAPPPFMRRSLRLREGIEWRYTPKHGSWLNMAEIEIGVAQRQCLDRRIADQPTVEKELWKWSENRNFTNGTTDWQFTTTDARIKL